MTPERRQQYILYFTMFQVMLGFGIVIPILPHFARELGANAVHMGLLITAWAGAQFLISPIWGALSDRIGRRPVLLLGLVGYVVNFFALSVATNIWVAVAVRFLGGLLSAAAVPTSQAYVADTSSGSERTSRITAMGAAMNMGFLLGPALGGLLAFLGFRGTMQAAGLLGLINLGLAYLMLPEPDRRQQSAARKGITGFRAVSIALRGPEAVYFLMAFGSTYGGSTLFSMLGYYLADHLGAGAQALSVAFTVQGVVLFVLQGLVIGRVTRTFGEVRTVIGALVAGIIGFAVIIYAKYFGLALFGVCLCAACFGTVRPVIAGLVSKKTRMEQGLTMGIQNAFDALGRTVGPVIAGAVYLWRDWAPFISAISMYAVFLLIMVRTLRVEEEDAHLGEPKAAD